MFDVGLSRVVLNALNPVVVGTFVLLVSMLQVACGCSGDDSPNDSAAGVEVQEAIPDIKTEVADATEVAEMSTVTEVAEASEALSPSSPPRIALSWIAPVEREDGTPISIVEIAGYRVYYGTEKGVYSHHIEIKGGGALKTTLTDLDAGVYYIAVTAVDVDGRESKTSEEVIKRI